MQIKLILGMCGMYRDITAAEVPMRGDTVQTSVRGYEVQSRQWMEDLGSVWVWLYDGDEGAPVEDRAAHLADGWKTHDESISF